MCTYICICVYISPKPLVKLTVFTNQSTTTFNIYLLQPPMHSRQFLLFLMYLSPHLIYISTPCDTPISVLHSWYMYGVAPLSTYSPPQWHKAHVLSSPDVSVTIPISLPLSSHHLWKYSGILLHLSPCPFYTCHHIPNSPISISLRQLYPSPNCTYPCFSTTTIPHPCYTIPNTATASIPKPCCNLLPNPNCNLSRNPLPILHKSVNPYCNSCLLQCHPEEKHIARCMVYFNLQINK